VLGKVVLPAAKIHYEDTEGLDPYPVPTYLKFAVVLRPRVRSAPPIPPIPNADRIWPARIPLRAGFHVLCASYPALGDSESMPK
jgi:hypothetical protein